jgi:peptidoglycan/xylan/chitin deacetylase (PgdA/CDA1 family)
MKLLKKQHQVVSLEQLEQGEFDKKRFAVALTFDDGYANNLRYAIPVLQELELPATFFVTAIRSVGRDILWPDLINLAGYEGIPAFDLQGERYVRHGVNSFRRQRDGLPLTTIAWQESDPEFIPALEVALEGVSTFRNRQEWKVYWEQLTAQEIGEIAAEYRFAIGSHSIRHQNLASLSPTAAQLDLALSKKWLEEVTGKPVERIAYPGGWASAALHEATFAAGYQQIYLDTYGNTEEAQHPQMHQRFGSHPKLSAIAQMYYLERGAY